MSESLEQRLLKQIEEEGIEPVSATRIWVERGMVWLAWVLVLVIGALAVAGTLFAFSETAWGLRRLAGGGYLDALKDSLPLLWVTFIGMAGAVLFIVYRRTEKGYRASAFGVLGLSVVGMGLVGGLFYTVGVGEMVEREIGARMPLHRTVYERNAVAGFRGAGAFSLVGDVEERGEDMVVNDVRGDVVVLRFANEEVREACTLAEGAVHVVGVRDGDGFVVCDVLSTRIPDEVLERMSTRLATFTERSRSGWVAPENCEMLRIMMRTSVERAGERSR